MSGCRSGLLIANERVAGASEAANRETLGGLTDMARLTVSLVVCGTQSCVAARSLRRPLGLKKTPETRNKLALRKWHGNVPLARPPRGSFVRIRWRGRGDSTAYLRLPGALQRAPVSGSRNGAREAHRQSGQTAQSARTIQSPCALAQGEPIRTSTI